METAKVEMDRMGGFFGVTGEHQKDLNGGDDPSNRAVALDKDHRIL